MITYISLLRFTELGAKQICQSTVRAATFKKAAEKFGVRVDAQYWTVGSLDGLLILSASDEKKILKCLAQLAVGGNVRTESLRALGAKEFDIMVRK